jgi:hypothetical protein
MLEKLDGAITKREKTGCGAMQKKFDRATCECPATIDKYEMNRRSPDSKLLMRIARKLKYQCGNLFL